MKQPKLRYSEAFYSVQGEGRFVGVPSVFLRVFGCNFECAGFGQERGKMIASDKMPYFTDPKADKEHPDAYKSIEELPVTPIGCDSSASWSKKYKHLQLTRSADEVFDHITSLIPNGTFTRQHGEDIHLVITGGEPLLGWQRVWPALLNMCREAGLINVTFLRPASIHSLRSAGQTRCHPSSGSPPVITRSMSSPCWPVKVPLGIKDVM